MTADEIVKAIDDSNEIVHINLSYYNPKDKNILGKIQFGKIKSVSNMKDDDTELVKAMKILIQRILDANN